MSSALRLKVVDGDDPAGDRPQSARTGHRRHARSRCRSAFPVALGVIYEDPRPTFESAVVEQNRAAASGKQADLQKLVARARPGWSKRSRTSSDSRRLVDNLTHSLVGAVLGRMGLKRLSPRAMPALIIAANLPDIDSWVAPWLGLRADLPSRLHARHRGLVVMPFVTVAIIWLWERLRPGKDGPVEARRIVARLLCRNAQPSAARPHEHLWRAHARAVSHRWFYGDTLFIVDPWIWIALIVALELSWRAERLGSDWQRAGGRRVRRRARLHRIECAHLRRAPLRQPRAGRARSSRPGRSSPAKCH